MRMQCLLWKRLEGVVNFLKKRPLAATRQQMKIHQRMRDWTRYRKEYIYKICYVILFGNTTIFFQETVARLLNRGSNASGTRSGADRVDKIGLDCGVCMSEIAKDNLCVLIRSVLTSQSTVGLLNFCYNS